MISLYMVGEIPSDMIFDFLREVGYGESVELI